MGKFDGYILFTDLDGTLTMRDDDGEAVISKENIDAINYFKDNGGKFSFSTGRLPEYVKESVMKFITPNAPVAVVGGSCIYDFDKDSYIRINYLDRHAYSIIYDIAENHREEFGNIYLNSEKCALEINLENFKGMDFVRDSLENNNWCKAVFTAKEERTVLDLKEKILSDSRYNKKFDFVRSWPTGLEILNIDSTKGYCVSFLKKHLNMTTSICVGDFENDISMIEEADIGYAVENAIDSVKAVADRITVSNEEHALAKIISDIDKKSF
ncbi:MAG: HAD-IIB family hydrolase [Clostridia bacterium]|nr:HAD-IIB family hydrolase [Clostridia bacterium]